MSMAFDANVITNFSATPSGVGIFCWVIQGSALVKLAPTAWLPSWTLRVVYSEIAIKLFDL